MSMMNTEINLDNYIIEQETPLTLQELKSQKRFELGTSLIIYSWNTLSTAVSNQWGGGDSSDKRDWLVGSVIDLFEENYIDAETIETRLLDVMEDEFNSQVDDGTALQIATRIIDIYRECSKDNFTTVDTLYKNFQQSQEQMARSIAAAGNAEETDEHEHNHNHSHSNGHEGENEDVEMADNGPIVDDDGFEVVSNKRKGRGRR